MCSIIKNIIFVSRGRLSSGYLFQEYNRKLHNVVFLDFYRKTTGQTIPEDYFNILKKKHPHLDGLSHDRIQCTLQILQKFDISPIEACQHLHVFSMNPITMDNYGEILKECGFLTISPKHIINYHTLSKSRNIAQLKKSGLLDADTVLEQNILNKLDDWPSRCRALHNYTDSQLSIVKVRMNVLERYLFWKLSVSSEEFTKYCKNYLPMKHKPMSDIQEAIDIAQNNLKLDNMTIRKNGFIISADPLHTKLLLENVKSLAGLDIRDVIKIEPAILKNNYNSIIQVRCILEEYRISEESQRRCLKVYCMTPETVQQRLEEFSNSKEYKILSTNPRVLYMVVYKKKMMNRLVKIDKVNKQCYSLNSLVSSNKIFNTYINSFGDKVCSRDIAILIITSLKNLSKNIKQADLIKTLKRHKYWLHAAINVIDENIKFLRDQFHDDTIFNNCHILLYPVAEVEKYIRVLLNIREGNQRQDGLISDLNYNTLKCSLITDDQLISLVLYQIEKKYHFSGDGIWTKNDVTTVDRQSRKL